MSTVARLNIPPHIASVFLAGMRAHGHLESAANRIGKILERSAFTDEQATRLLFMQLSPEPIGRLSDEIDHIVAAANIVAATSTAILRLSPQPREQFTASADVWIDVLEADRREQAAQPKPFSNTPSSVSQDPNWWPASYYSWKLASKVRVPSTAFFFANLMRRAGLAKHSTEKYLLALQGETSKDVHHRLLAVKAVRDEDLERPTAFMTMVRSRTMQEIDEGVLAVLNKDRSSLSKWWQAKQTKAAATALAVEAASVDERASSFLRAKQGTTTPAVVFPAKAKPTALDPLMVGSLVHRKQLNVMLEVLWRGRFIGTQTLSIGSIKNLARDRTNSDLSLADLTACLDCLERMGLLMSRRKAKDSISLLSSPSSIAGRKIMAKLKARFPR
ncbi:MAG: hypothetical protein UY72_C0014G0007 [Candidatus Uhrbacteria bacterium GW2011_GWD2_52_7]|uniref:Uncharacterized protein n=1 Tax=Candidatus Uhrbacteria bacterium GW2011_GWD2_52_7 TaxID=1618989 RepID=A0A0G1XHF7_9BACT|nr:MAG: hypothetical protein UY72_C0014G0007 [Candidatus Uhrbacteria bacterium GW2011_GWD2_52_7]